MKWLLSMLFFLNSYSFAQQEVVLDSTVSFLSESEFSAPLHKKMLPEAVVSQPAKSVISEYDFNSVQFVLSVGILVFGLIVLFLEVWMIKQKILGEENSIKFFIITLIITAILFLTTSGTDTDDIAPAMGLFGTITGYLLGKTHNKRGDEK